MTAVALYQSGFSLKSASNCPIVLLAQIDCMRSLTRALGRFFILRPSYVARLSVWRKQGTKLGSIKIAATSKIVSTMQAGLRSRSSICNGLFNLIARGYSHTAKLRLTFSSAGLLANGRVLIKVLSSFFLPILSDEKRRRNRGALDKKASSKATFLILLLYNSSEDTLLLLLLHPLIVSSNLCFHATKLGVSFFGENNAGKGREDDLESTGVDRKIRVDNLGIGTDVITRTDNPCT